MTTPLIVFHIVFVQDVAVLRPLMILAKALGKRLELFVSLELKKHDSDGSRMAEVGRLISELSLPTTYYDSSDEVCRHLEGKSGLFIVGNESSVPPHHVTHDLFKVLPSSFLKVTMQHGFECVGFLHNAAHEAAYGREIQFAADVVVGWFAKELLTSMHPGELPKLFVAGPPHMIAPRPQRMRMDGTRAPVAMVCDNLHSVRFPSPGVQEIFLEQFFAFANRYSEVGGRIEFRCTPPGALPRRSAWPFPQVWSATSDRSTSRTLVHSTLASHHRHQSCLILS